MGGDADPVAWSDPHSWRPCWETKKKWPRVSKKVKNLWGRPEKIGWPAVYVKGELGILECNYLCASSEPRGRLRPIGSAFGEAPIIKFKTT